MRKASGAAARTLRSVRNGGARRYRSATPAPRSAASASRTRVEPQVGRPLEHLHEHDAGEPADQQEVQRLPQLFGDEADERLDRDERRRRDEDDREREEHDVPPA